MVAPVFKLDSVISGQCLRKKFLNTGPSPGASESAGKLTARSDFILLTSTEVRSLKEEAQVFVLSAKHPSDSHKVMCKTHWSKSADQACLPLCFILLSTEYSTARHRIQPFSHTNTHQKLVLWFSFLQQVFPKLLPHAL